MIDRLKAGTKRRARGLTDRVLAPYVNRLADEIRAASPAGAPQDGPGGGEGVPSDFFHGILHELRTVELERAPKGCRRVLSVGASGRWYFDWFEASVNAVDEHIGIEAFEPEPDDLPPYVRWIPTTADRFDGVDDGSIDLVFAGQTSEHLWAAELTGFLLESRRVLGGDGVLVLDSPNRLVTEHLHWSHGGHTVELSAGEIQELLALAGFRTDDVRGLWRCRFGDEVLELEQRLDDAPLLVRRTVEAAERPDDSFVWWLVARPAGEPDAGALRARVDELFRQHWPTRVCRGMWDGPGVDVVHWEAGDARSIASLPFMLHAGRWRIGVQLASGSLDDLDGLRLDVTAPGSHRIHRLEPAAATIAAPSTIVWELDQEFLGMAYSLELHVGVVVSPVDLVMPLSIELVDSSTG